MCHIFGLLITYLTISSSSLASEFFGNFKSIIEIKRKLIHIGSQLELRKVLMNKVLQDRLCYFEAFFVSCTYVCLLSNATKHN